jgi:hypothetical protein
MCCDTMQRQHPVAERIEPATQANTMWRRPVAASCSRLGI